MGRYLMRRSTQAVVYLLAVLFGLPGLLALVFEVLVWAAGDGRAFSPLGQVWFQHDPFLPLIHTASLPLLGAIIERRVSPYLWDPLLVTILNWPSWLALLVVALFFLAISGVLVVSANWMGSARTRRFSLS